LDWSSRHQRESIARAITGGDPARASDIMRRYGCAGCHSIEGVPAVTARSADRSPVSAAGSLSPASRRIRRTIWSDGSSLLRFFHHERQCRQPGSAKTEARDVAAYLYAQ